MSGTIADRTIKVPEILSEYSYEELNSEYHAAEDYAECLAKYGVIYKTISMSEISKASDLRTKTYEWIKRNFYDGVLSFTVKAVDLHLLRPDKDKLMVGDRITVEFIDDGQHKVTRQLTCLSASYDLINPGNTTYKIGIPDVSTNVKYRKSLSSTSSTDSSSNNNNNDNTDNATADLASTWRQLFVDTSTSFGVDLGNVEDLTSE